MQILTVRDENGVEQTLKVTEEHPLYRESDGWTPARKLDAGDIILGADGTLTVVSNEAEQHPGGVTVYNLEVEQAHTYFVLAEDAHDAAAVWVHNASATYANLNSNKARASYAVYEIEVNGRLHKIGKAHTGRVTRETGLPTRLHQQVRKLRSIHGEENVSYTLDRLGRTTTAKAKLAESRRLQIYFDRTGVIPEGNRKSFRPH